MAQARKSVKKISVHNFQHRPQLDSVIKGICLMMITIIMTNISIALIQIVPNSFQFSTYVTSINTSQKKKLMKQKKLIIKNWWNYALKRCVFSLISLKHTFSIFIAHNSGRTSLHSLEPQTERTSVQKTPYYMTTIVRTLWLAVFL